jgi:hypothetical protein
MVSRLSSEGRREAISRGAVTGPGGPDRARRHNQHQDQSKSFHRRLPFCPAPSVHRHGLDGARDLLGAPHGGSARGVER